MLERNSLRLATQSLSLVMIPLLSGCVSTDPSKDIQQAAALVEARTGLKADWRVDEILRPDVWDGRSTLTVRQAVMLGLRNNRTIQARLEDIAGARADLVQSGLLPNPVLSVAYGFPLGGGAGGPTAGASLIQDFTAIWLRPLRTKGAGALLQSQVLGVSNDALRLVADVKQAHARIVFTQRAVNLLLSQIDLAQQAINLTQSRVNAGEAGQLDLNRNRLLLLTLQSQIVNRRATLAKERQQFLLLIGRADLRDQFDVEDPAAHVAASDLTESQVIALARQQRLDVVAAHYIYESRARELQLDRLGRIPALSLGGNFQRENDGGKELGPEAQITVPLFDQNQARIAKAKSNLRKAAIEADRIMQDAISQARLAWIDWRVKLDQIRFYQDQLLDLAKKNLDLSEKARKAGTVDQTVFLEAQRERISAQSSLLDLEREAALSSIELEYAVGGNLHDPHGDPSTKAVEPRKP